MINRYMPVRHFDTNRRGRDYVVGGLGGAIDAFEDALTYSNFDVDVDRVFCVGGAINGRQLLSHRFIELLAQPWFYSVRGSNEEKFLDIFHTKNEVTREMYAAQCEYGDWVHTAFLEELYTMHDKISLLPYAIEIQTPRGKVGIVHADVPQNMSWQDFKHNLAEEDFISVWSAVNGTDRIDERRQDSVEGIDRVFVGHRPHSSKVRRYGNVCVIDTGAMYAGTPPMEDKKGNPEDYCLTMANICSPWSVLKSNEPPQDFVRILCPQLIRKTPFHTARPL